MITKKADGNYLPKWRDMVAKGRARKRAVRPKRNILSIQQALSELHLRYCQEVSFWNPRHTGRHDDLDGGLQWVDFVIRPYKKRPFVIILDDPTKRWKAYEKKYYSNKLIGLNERGIDYIILPQGFSSQEYKLKITWHMHKIK